MNTVSIVVPALPHLSFFFIIIFIFLIQNAVEQAAFKTILIHF